MGFFVFAESIMSDATDWRPTAPLEALKQRAVILRKIRTFFAEREVLEVETPVLCNASVTDVHLHSFNTQFISPISPDEQALYLQTSPEFAMKRLLCAGSGAIYQITKSFRNEEAGRYHNPEFTMLEWYRPGFDDRQLMVEVDELLQHILETAPAEVMSYQQAFERVLGFNPHEISMASLKQQCAERGFASIAEIEDDTDTLLQLLFSECIESEIGQHVPCLVHSFPATQAALARIDPDNPMVAKRFEAYFRGVELANGFHELADPVEQGERFECDNEKRSKMGLNKVPIDKRFLAALKQGLPDCAGVALGVDRLIMLALNKQHIREVVAFNVDNA